MYTVDEHKKMNICILNIIYTPRFYIKYTPTSRDSNELILCTMVIVRIARRPQLRKFRRHDKSPLCFKMHDSRKFQFSNDISYDRRISRMKQSKEYFRLHFLIIDVPTLKHFWHLQAYTFQLEFAAIA